MVEVAKAGDHIKVDSDKAGTAARGGVIVEVIEHDYGPSYRVRWDDGHESTIRPVAGTVHVEHPQPAGKR